MVTSVDREMMARALRLARCARYSTRPNPSVGCVLARDGVVIGEGSTQPAGGNHAEIEAIAACADPRGACAYVTLEPCSHEGRTGPCVDAVIAAGIRQVFLALRDPNPQVAGAGINRLRSAGIEVNEGLMAAEARAVNRGFLHRMEKGLPHVRIKLGASLDGRTAMASGESQWITGPAARADVQALRAESCAIITGSGTVLADNPALTVRDERFEVPGQPLRVIVDSQLRTPPNAAILQQPGATLIAHVQGASGGEALIAAGALMLPLPAAVGGVDLHALLRQLAQRQCNAVLVECGAGLAGAFLREGLLDELVFYFAPSLLGSAARPLFDLPLQHMADKVELRLGDIRKVGEDLRITCLPV